jgi:hypothetical protein
MCLLAWEIYILSSSVNVIVELLWKSFSCGAFLHLKLELFSLKNELFSLKIEFFGSFFFKN